MKTKRAKKKEKRRGSLILNKKKEIATNSTPISSFSCIYFKEKSCRFSEHHVSPPLSPLSLSQCEITRVSSGMALLPPVDKAHVRWRSNSNDLGDGETKDSQR